MYIGLPTCIELFDELAADFMENKSDRNKIIDLTGNEISKIEDKTKRVSLRMGFLLMLAFSLVDSPAPTSQRRIETFYSEIC